MSWFVPPVANAAILNLSHFGCMGLRHRPIHQAIKPDDMAGLQDGSRPMRAVLNGKRNDPKRALKMPAMVSSRSMRRWPAVWMRTVVRYGSGCRPSEREGSTPLLWNTKTASVESKALIKGLISAVSRYLARHHGRRGRCSAGRELEGQLGGDVTRVHMNRLIPATARIQWLG